MTTVVLYCEGAGEAPNRELPASLQPLPANCEGAGHILVSRSLAHVSRSSASAEFLVPLRLTGRHSVQARPPRGSDLHSLKNLRRLCTAPDPNRRPDLWVVLIDHDGDSQRQPDLTAGLQGQGSPVVVGCANREFESWLLSDQATVRALFPGRQRDELADLEQLDPGEAKRILTTWIAESRDATDHFASRVELARKIRLDEVARRNRSYMRFLQALRAALESSV